MTTSQFDKNNSNIFVNDPYLFEKNWKILLSIKNMNYKIILIKNIQDSDLNIVQGIIVIICVKLWFVR